jgi:hypothetical protein
MTGMGRRERHADAPVDETAGDLLTLAASLRDRARLSAHNVVVLGEQIAGRRAAAGRAPRPRSPLERWLDAHGLAAQRAMTGLAEMTTPFSALALWTELADRWLDANITLAEAWIGPMRG